jgi:hypothetical protein
MLGILATHSTPQGFASSSFVANKKEIDISFLFHTPSPTMSVKPFTIKE